MDPAINKNFLDVFRRQYGHCNLPTLDLLEIPLNNSPYFQSYLSRFSSACFEPGFAVIDRGFVLPYVMNRQVPEDGIVDHVVYDSELKPVRYGDHIKAAYRGYRDNLHLPRYPDASMDDYVFVEGECLYMGLLLEQIGHFIMETLPRFFYALQYPVSKETKFIFNILPGRNLAVIKKRLFEGLWKDYFEVMGVTEDNFLFVEKPMRVERLVVPQSPLAIGFFGAADCFLSRTALDVWRYFNQTMTAAYEQGGGRFAGNYPDRIYMSRRKVNYSFRSGAITNEDELEELFASRGFHICFPEELESEYEKQALLANVKIVAGPPSSGMLNCIFMPAGKKLLSIVSENMNKGIAAYEQVIIMGHWAGHRCYAYYENDYTDDESRMATVNLEAFAGHLDRFLISSPGE